MKTQKAGTYMDSELHDISAILKRDNTLQGSRSREGGCHRVILLIQKCHGKLSGGVGEGSRVMLRAGSS